MAAVSDRGRVRERNEDALAIDESLGMAVVADGMGGLSDGDVASREAVAAVAHSLASADRPRDSAALAAALWAANRRVHGLARSRGVIMGSTAVLLTVDDAWCRIGNVGDSRAYRFHDGVLSALTRDHSLVQEMLERGVLTREAARRSDRRHIVTRALGLDATVEPDVVELQLEAGDLLLLCSDGLWEMLDDEHIAAVVRECGAGRQGLERCARALVDGANRAGGLDNVSVVLVRHSAGLAQA